jgi:hypothetical protein
MIPQSKKDAESRQPQAMREFNYAPYKRKNRFAKKLKTYLNALLPVFILMCMTAAGIWAGFQCNKTTQVKIAVQENNYPRRVLPLDTLHLKSNFLNDYLKFKLTAASNISKKLEVTGTYQHGSETHSFAGIFDLLGNGTFEIDSEASRSFKFQGGDPINEQAQRSKTDIYALQAFLHSMQDPLLTLGPSDLDRLIGITTTQFKGKEVYKAYLTTNNLRQNISLIIKPDNYSLIERLERGKHVQTETYQFSDYKIIAGIRIPFKISISSQSGQIYSFRLNSLRSIEQSPRIASLAN